MTAVAALGYWLWLSSAELSLRAKAALLERFGDAETAFSAPTGAFLETPGLSKQEAELLERRDLSRVREIAAACAQQELRIVTMQDAAYPARLRYIFAPPVVLYVKGELPPMDSSVAIAVVGTRRASVYGRKMARDLAYQMAASGAVILSGLTAGIDAEAAWGALAAGGTCIGVLGTPHEAERGQLAETVAARGALISEYAPGTRPQRSFFRERNRITAGLSLGVLAVEAPEKSGTRLFVEEAAAQGKEIFAVPGNADAESSAGTLAMLKDGAKLATCGWDVLSEFEPLYPGALRKSGVIHAPEEPAPKPVPVGEKAAPAEKKPKAALDKPRAGGYIDLKQQLSELSEDQLRIIAAMDAGPLHVDDIVERSQLPIAKVLAQLTMLELKGYVGRLPGRLFERKITKK